MLSFLKRLLGRTFVDGVKIPVPKSVSREEKSGPVLTRRQAVKLKHKQRSEYWRDMYYLKNILPKEEKSKRKRLKQEQQ